MEYKNKIWFLKRVKNVGAAEDGKLSLSKLIFYLEFSSVKPLTYQAHESINTQLHLQEKHHFIFTSSSEGGPQNDMFSFEFF